MRRLSSVCANYKPKSPRSSVENASPTDVTVALQVIVVVVTVVVVVDVVVNIIVVVLLSNSNSNRRGSVSRGAISGPHWRTSFIGCFA